MTDTTSVQRVRSQWWDVWDQFKTHKLKVTDVTGAVVHQIRRPAKIMKSAVVVGDSAGRELGRFDDFGTTLNARAYFTPKDNGIYFQTAWSNPFPVMEALSRKYPDVVFHVRFADEDFGHNVGEYSLKNGDTISENIPEGGSEEAYEMAADITGYESYLTDRVYDIEAETIDSLEDYEKQYIKAVYDKEVIEDFPRVVIDYMLELAVADENFELATRLRDLSACNDED